MTLWIAVLGASLACAALKVAGWLVPESALANPRLQRILAVLPLCMLSALVAVQAFTAQRSLVVDARLPALLVAALVLWRRGGFLLAVAAAGVTAALVRLLVPDS